MPVKELWLFEVKPPVLLDYQFHSCGIEFDETEPEIPQADHAEDAVIKAVCQNLKEARLICKFTINKSAALLDVDPAFLDRVEKAIEIPPLSLIQKASKIYDVSVDYIFGLNEDWEVAPEVRASRDITSFILEHRVEMFTAAAVKHLAQQRSLDNLGGIINALRLELAEMYEGFERFRELNQGFDDLPGGSQLQYRMEKANEAAIRAQMALIRAKVLPKPEKLPDC